MNSIKYNCSYKCQKIHVKIKGPNKIMSEVPFKCPMKLYLTLIKNKKKDAESLLITLSL